MYIESFTPESICHHRQRKNLSFWGGFKKIGYKISFPFLLLFPVSKIKVLLSHTRKTFASFDKIERLLQQRDVIKFFTHLFEAK